MPPGPTIHDTLLAQSLLPAAELEAGSETIRRGNAALANLLDRTPVSLAGQPFSLLVDPAERTAVRAHLFAGADATPLPCHLVPDTGRPHPVSLTLHSRPPTRRRGPPAGRLVLILPSPPELPAACAEAALPAPEQGNIFRHIVLSANEGIWTIDADQRTTFVNPRMAEMLGYPEEALRGRPITDYILPEDLAAHADQLARRRGGLADRYERRFRRHDGTVLWTLVAGTPLHDADGRYQGSFGLFSDITERKRSDHALQLSEERYRSLLAAATDYVFTVPYHDGQPGVTLHGPGCVKVTGYEPHDYTSDPFLWYRMIAPDDRSVVEQHIQRATGGERADTIEHRLLHRDGSVRWVRNTLVPRRDSAGRLVALDGLVTDITERTAALRQLRERESLYRAVIETSVDGFWITDFEGRLLEVNDAYVRRSGYTRAELLDLRVSTLEAAESATETAAHIARVRRDGYDLFESRHRTKDGTIWQVEVNATYWPIGDGRLFVFIRDINRRKRSEALLRARLQFSELSRRHDIDSILQAALDHAELHTGSSLGFFHFVDPDQENLTLQTWSTSTLRDHCRAEGKGRHYPVAQAGIWVDCLRQRTAVIHNDYAAHPAKKGLPPGHAPLVRVLTVPLLRDDRVIAVIGVGNKTTDYTADDIEIVRELADVAMDFVQRLHAVQSLRRSEHQLRLIIDSVPALIAYVDTALRYRLLNRTFHLWFGEPLAAILGRTVSEQVGPEAWTELAPLFARALAGETVVFEKQIQLSKAGLRWLHGSYTPDHGPDGQVRGVVELVHDVSAHKQLEAQLLRAQRLEVVGRLASGVAHDLNNILQPVLMAPRLLRPAISDPDTLALVDTIEGSVRRGAEIIKQLLAFGRGTEVRRVPLQLEPLVADLVRMLRETLPKDIVLRCELPPLPHRVLADPTQVHQVLMNLCVNARDAMPEGGTLTIRVEQAAFAQPLAEAIPAGRTGRFQVLVVSDTGTGIAPEDFPKLFDPFFTTKDVGEGTGLGLPTVLGIVRSHEGFVHVASTPGRGSVFRVFLPENDHPAGPPAPAAAAGEAAVAAGRQVLVVDDEEPVRALIRQTLVAHGFRIREAANGAEALVLLAQRESGIDLVIADLLMPVMDGASLIHELHRRRPKLPVIAMSGHLGHSQVAPALRPAIRALLPKPFDAAQLLAAIHHATAA